MNVLKNRLANTSFILRSQCGGAAGHQSPNGYVLGEQLRTTQDVDLQIESGIVSVPKGTVATVRENNSQQVLLDLGEQLGKFVLEMSTVGTYFERAPKTESVVPQNRRRVRQMLENTLVATPGAYVEVTSYDANIGPNRGPKSPGMGGYATLIGQKGQIATIFGEIKGVKTYKVQLVLGGEFVLGETEFKVITGVGTQESKDDSVYKIQECDSHALMGLGFGL